MILNNKKLSIFDSFKILSVAETTKNLHPSKITSYTVFIVNI